MFLIRSSLGDFLRILLLQYQILASFAGDDSHGGSSAATAVTVGPAPTPIEFPPATEPVDNTMLLYGILVAVIIAVIASLAALAIVLRKR